MGYFSNGTEAAIYQAEWCNRCVHDEEACPVWVAHLIFNYDLVNAPSSTPGGAILDMLIPREGVFNGQCTMFKEAP